VKADLKVPLRKDALDKGTINEVTVHESNRGGSTFKMKHRATIEIALKSCNFRSLFKEVYCEIASDEPINASNQHSPAIPKSHDG
jgi:hypothetical protein